MLIIYASSLSLSARGYTSRRNGDGVELTFSTFLATTRNDHLDEMAEDHDLG